MPQLYVSPDQSHGAGVGLLSIKVIVDDGDDHRASNDEAIPVHGLYRHGSGDWEKDEDVDEEQEDNGANVDGQAIFAQAPSAWR